MTMADATMLQPATLEDITADGPAKTTGFRRFCRVRYDAACRAVTPDSEYLRIFRFLRRESETAFTSRHRDTFVLLAAVSLASLSGVPLPVIGVIFGKIINEFPPEEASLRSKLVQMMVVATVNFFAIWGYTYCWGYVGTRISQSIRTVVLDRVLHMDIAYHETRKIDLANYLLVDVQTIQTGTGEKVGIFIQSISYFVTAIVVGLVLNARFTAILMAVVVPSILLITVVCERLNRRFTKRLAETSSRAAEILGDVVRMITVVQAFGLGGLFREKNREVLAAGQHYGIRRSFVIAVRLGFLFFLAYGVNSLAFWYGIRQVNAHATDAGTIYTIIFLMLDASFIISQFGPFLHTFSLAATSSRRIDSLLRDAEEHCEKPDARYDSEFAWSAPYDIRFESARFAYPTRPDVTVLKDVNLHIKAGSFTAIVGRSGSGKSSLTALLLRFYKATAGTIYLNERDLATLPVKMYRRHVAYVEQDPVLFSGTIRENILHGVPDADKLSDARAATMCAVAAALANAREFIEALPAGFDTLVGPDGASQLSGGQVARIALARALVSRPRVLILDEVTASLDIHSENTVMSAVRQLHAETNMTIIMITHRLSSVATADKIIVMAAGSVIEEGTHDELVAAEGAYSKLLATQKKSAPSREVAAERAAAEPGKAGLQLTTVRSEESHVVGKKSLCLPRGAEFPSSSMKRTLEMCRPDFPIIVAGILSSMLTGSLVVAESVLFGYIIASLRGELPARGPQSPNFYCLMFFVVGVVALVAHSAAGFCFGVVSERLVARLRDLCFHKITLQDLSFFADPTHAETALVASIQSDTAALTSLSGVMIGTVVSVATTLVGGVVVAHVVAWRIAAVLLPALPVIVLAGYLRLRVLMQAQEKQETTYVKAASMATEATNAMRTVASLVREDGVMREYKAELSKAEKGHTAFILQGSAIMALALSIGFFVYALAYWWGARQVREGRYGIVEFFIVLPALLFSAQTAGQVFSLAPEFTKAAGAARRIFKLLDSRPSIAAQQDDVDGSPAASTVADTTAAKGGIEFRNVTFAYPTRPDARVLRSLSLAVKPGEFVAIVGESGSGKSSLLALIQRFYDPTAGSVLVDGLDITTLPVAQHRARISILAQDLTLFSESIYFNVAAGLSGGAGAGAQDPTTRTAVEEACKKVGMHEFIMSLPEGYDSRCSRATPCLSGGQIQRLALARALICDPEVLVLDEPTSALDVCAEETVMRAVLEARGAEADGAKRTVVMVAHRLGTVVGADKIVVVRKGKVVEVGTHEELVAMGGVYADMAAQQGL
ncbi:ABC multidrug transporter mdr4 [Drechslerella dactyloides]|uniref:ABC multidrug transporter mdr4 n=1 Tax=Drechslerella dactyloides TaxID=74499 RepID=A0AAD6NHG6_DREDA|nr:ABC multidrug transporter mdr4 [Drechslerella dactyloides]